MLHYLKFRGAPKWLIDQAEQYKMMLWNMKDGIVTSNHLQQLPTTLQMELIFDINVGFFHKSRVFRDTGRFDLYFLEYNHDFLISCPHSTYTIFLPSDQQ